MQLPYSIKNCIKVFYEALPYKDISIFLLHLEGV